MRRSVLIAALVGAVAFFLISRRSDAATVAIGEGDDLQVSSDDPNYWYFSSDDADTVGAYDMGSPEQNLLAILALIRKFETNNKYNALYGGGTFSDYSAHPNQRIPITIPGYEGKFSTAAGAYQFLYKTWSNLASRLSLTDFSPASQDAAAVELLNEIGALPDIQAGNFDAALRIASSQWASLPYSQAKQSPKSIASANEFLTRYLDSLA